MAYTYVREEELKNKVAQEYFAAFDCTKIISNVDFCVAVSVQQISLFEQPSLLWAEAKKGESDIYKSIVQLILTIGKARTFDTYLPPSFLGAFDAEKIAFIPYSEIHDVFYQNDFNWNVTPSNHTTKEFLQVLEKVKTTIDEHALLFYFGTDDVEIEAFIKQNFVAGNTEASKIKIDKNNFMIIYNKWLTAVKPSIMVNWEVAQKNGIIDGDFYLADLLSAENETLKDSLYVLLKKDVYELDRTLNDMGMFHVQRTTFRDKQKAHTQFWNRYERPPKEEYWDYIVNRRDLLVPQDVRERKGSFFTPQIWVELSQKYLADVLGEHWQDEYYIWDCAAGTGNLLAGLTNKYHIFASTLDRQDVDVMKDRIANGANLLEKHVFQFDFLNDDFSKLPKALQDIINDVEKRKKLVVYINPPYAEVSSKAIKGKVGVNQTNIHKKYGHVLGTAGRELYAQFLIRIYAEIPNCVLAEFSTLKILQGSAFEKFRNFFCAKLAKCFVVPARTFDNVNGYFPIGFKIWNTAIKDTFDKIEADIMNEKGQFNGQKTFYAYNKADYINKWISAYKTIDNHTIGYMDGINGNDFQHNSIVYILNRKEQLPNPRGIWITKENLIVVSIYHAVRRCITNTWLNNQDQFLYPNENWDKDTAFQNDCLVYTLFHGQNRISSNEGTNHWIPFTEYEVNAQEKFASNFMADFIKGKLKPQKVEEALFKSSVSEEVRTTPLVFSMEAKAVFEAGKALWRYYHAQKDVNVNASLYEIREYFQGRSEKGKMNNKSEDDRYTKLVADLREKLGLLATKIEPKVYEYGFLKG